jgi:hypothetical protein
MSKVAIYEKEIEVIGTLRITNSKTLQKWKDCGYYDKLINEGFIYAKGCGRFIKEKCNCSKCKKLLIINK